MKLENVLRKISLGALMVGMGIVTTSIFSQYKVESKKSLIQNIVNQNPQLKIEVPAYEREEKTAKYVGVGGFGSIGVGIFSLFLVDYVEYRRKKKNSHHYQCVQGQKNL